MPGRTEDYSKAHNLLPFIARFIQANSRFETTGVRMVRDGSLAVRLGDKSGNCTEVSWIEQTSGAGSEVTFNGVTVRTEPSSEKTAEEDLSHSKKACLHVARRIARLLKGSPPNLLLWRNRNKQTISWSSRLFNNLCPGLLVKNQTTFFDYSVSEIDEFEGFINIEFSSRHASVRLRLVLGEYASDDVLYSWGPISMVLLEDGRSQKQRSLPEHQVEEFLGYLLSRNLPPLFDLEFERGDPPAGFMPSDMYVDFLRRTRLDDTGFFEMLFTTSREIAVVTSCDRECFNLFSFISGPRERWATNSPWQLTPSSDLFNHYYNLNADSQTAIMGENRLEKCLETIDASPNPPRLIIFFDSCLGKLIGDDVTGAISHFNSKSKIPLVYYDIRLSQFPYLGQLRNFWKALFEKVDKDANAVEPGTVYFLGLPPAIRSETDAILKEMEIRNLGTTFPTLDMQDFLNLPRSSLLVMNNWEYIRVMFMDMLKLLDVPTVRQPLPFGIRATDSWFEAISRAVHGDGAHFDRDIDWVDDLTEAFEAARSQIKGCRIGVFARLRNARNALSANLRFGVPLLPLFRELGLGIDLNLYVGVNDEPDSAALESEFSIDRGRGDSIGFFEDFRQLPAIIRTGDFPMVYTETYRDERITACGKYPFSLGLIAPGYSGAVRTANNVLAAKNATFFRRYHAFFKQPFSHLSQVAAGNVDAH